MPLQQVDEIRCEEGHVSREKCVRNAALSSACSSNAVRVRFQARRHIVVYDGVECAHVDTARGNVGRYKYLYFACFKFLKHPLTLCLR